MAKSKLDNIFKGKFDKNKISDIEESDNSNSKVLPKNIEDENLTTKSSRHNQIVSLLTEIYDTNLDSTTSSPQSKVFDISNDNKEDDISQKNDTSIIQDETSLFTETLNIPTEPDFSDNSSSSSSSDMFSDISDSSKQSTDSSSDNTSRERVNKPTLKKQGERLSNKRLCYQALKMIKFLGTIHLKKLDLKHEPRLRRIAFLDWIEQLEIAFSSNEYTGEVLRDYSTT